MQKLIILAGPSGVGKSTYVQEQMQKEENCILISTDAIRKSIFGEEGVQDNPWLVFQKAFDQMEEALQDGQSVIFDATNMTRRSRHDVLLRTEDFNISRELHMIIDSPEQCVKNQEKRERKVPAEVVLSQIRRFDMPSESEGFDQIVFRNKTDKEKMFRYLNTEVYTDNVFEAAPVSTSLGGWTPEERLDSIRTIHAMHKMSCLYPENGKQASSMWDGSKLSAWLYLCFYGDKEPEAIKENARIIQERTWKDISLRQFIKTRENWKEELKQQPFCIRIQENGPYVLLKYHQFDSCMDYRLVQECRGCILKEKEGKWKYVCRPFDKFFNYGETTRIPDIDPRTARLTEKVDGSLMKVFYDKGWHLATNGMIDAFQSPVYEAFSSPDMDQVSLITFGQIFLDTIGMELDQFAKNFDPAKTYMFELTSPETRLVVEYPARVYYLAARDTQNGKEIRGIPEEILERKDVLHFPEEYKFHSLEEAVQAAKKLDKDHEGFVLSDAKGNRIKLKGDAYLKQFFQQSMGEKGQTMSYSKIIRAIQENADDDLVAYCPSCKERVEQVKEKMHQLAEGMEKAWEEQKEKAGRMDKKEYVLSMPPRQEHQGYLFKKYDRPDMTAEGYLKEQAISTIARLIGVKEKNRTGPER